MRNVTITCQEPDGRECSFRVIFQTLTTRWHSQGPDRHASHVWDVQHGYRQADGTIRWTLLGDFRESDYAKAVCFAIRLALTHMDLPWPSDQPLPSLENLQLLAQVTWE